MLRSLIPKVTLLLLGLFFFVGLSFAMVSQHYLHLSMLEIAQRLNRSVTNYIVAEVLSKKPRPFDNNTLHSNFEQLMLINPSNSIY